jgi:hypothetical protein
MAGGGDGMILSDCDVTGCSELRFSMKETAADRNYVTGVRVNADECTVLDDQESIIEIDGLDLDDCVRGDLNGPLILIMSADRTTLKAGETATICLRGLQDDMFVGWKASDPATRLTVDGAFTCRVTAPEQIDGNRTMVVSAYTEYGLEAACVITLDSGKTITENKSRKKRK